MKLVDFATRRPVTIGMITVAILLFGAVSASRLKLNLLPDLSYPSLTVRTEFVGAAPSEIESLITKPVEETLGVVKNVRQVRSVSRSGQSDVTLEFHWGTNMDSAVLDTREKLDALELPEEIRRPLVLRFDPAAEPIMRLGFALKSEQDEGRIRQADNKQLMQLRRFAERRIQRELEAAEGVAAVKISGGLEDEIQVLVDQARLAQLGIAIEDVIQRIRVENVNLSGGRVEEGTFRYLVRTLNQFQSIDDIRQTILKTEEGRPIYLRDVAQVDNGHREREAIIRIDGEEAVEIAIYKEGDANTVTVSRSLDKRLEFLKKELPQRYSLTKLYDQSKFIRQAIQNVLQSAVVGGVLAVLVLFLFLRNARSTFIIALAIPVSVVATFNMMYGADLSLNIMSLGGIALAIGLLVDNAIVVLENIARYREQGVSTLEAVQRGAGEVGGAVIASTLTTVAVFFPMVFVQGVAGQLFSDQALVVTFALVVSLMVSLTVIPVFSARGTAALRPKLETEDSNVEFPANRVLRFFRWIAFWIARIMTFLSTWLVRSITGVFWLIGWLLNKLLVPLVWVFQRFYGLLERNYPHLLQWSLGHRGLVILVAVGMFAWSLSLLPRIGVELIPGMAQGEFSAELTLPPGTPLRQTDRVLNTIQRSVQDLNGIGALYSVAGTGNRLDADPEAGGESFGALNVSLDRGAPPNTEEAIKQHVRKQLSTVPGLEYRFTQPTLFSFDTPLEIELAGYRLDELKTLNKQLLALLRADDRFTDVESSMERGFPEIQIRFDEDRVAALDLLVSDLAQRVVHKVRGDVASRYRLRDREIDILVRAQERDRASVERIRNLIINPESAHPITLGAVAEVSQVTGPAEIRRIDQQRVAVIQANLAYGDLGTAVQQAKQMIEQLHYSENVGIRVTGQNEEMQVSFDSLKLALLLAIFMVYLVMASQFESMLHPFVILLTIPLAGIGAILALFVTGSVVNVVVFIGLIVLAGIVVNNGIVLIDLINRLRADGQERNQAILEAGKARLRPIVMTTLTTALGLLPLAIGIGEGAEIRAPLAITVIGGLLVATLLTLVVIPVVYTMVDRRVLAQDKAATMIAASETP